MGDVRQKVSLSFSFKKKNSCPSSPRAKSLLILTHISTMLFGSIFLNKVIFKLDLGLRILNYNFFKLKKIWERKNGIFLF